MTGKPEDDRCYFCGGKLSPGLATLPFVVGSSVVIIKQVPAEVCSQCSEAIMDSEVAQVVDGMLKQAQRSGFEVTIATFEQKEALTPV
jgi:YgiT-type zinc finger domain-containing protein